MNFVDGGNSGGRSAVLTTNVDAMPFKKSSGC